MHLHLLKSLEAPAPLAALLKGANQGAVSDAVRLATGCKESRLNCGVVELICSRKILGDT